MIPRPRSVAAFTLLEIVLAVGIGVIFMGGAVVFLSSTGGDRELIQARKMLEAAAGEAREKALGSGREQRVVLDFHGVAGQEFPGEVEMFFLTPQDLAFGRRDWAKPEKYQWLVTGGGLVEPIRVRLRHDENTEQFSFGVLTGETMTEKPDRR